MKVEDLKNFGRPLNELMAEIPGSVQRMMAVDALKVIKKHLGFAGTVRVFIGAWKEMRCMKSIDLSIVRQKGVKDEKFIKTMTGNAALFSAMKKMTDMEKTLVIHFQIMDKIAGPMNLAMLPPVSEIKKFQEKDGAFDAFRQYIMALFAADKKAGLHDFEIVENSDKAVAIDVTWCAYCKIPELLGILEACEPACYSDEVFFPGFLEPLGIRFIRTRTLGKKGNSCDFRFELIE